MKNAEASIVERHANGNTATTVIGPDAVEYYVTDAAGVLRWSRSVPFARGAQRTREAAAAEQARQLEAIR